MASRALVFILILLLSTSACGRKKARVFPDQPIRANDPVVQRDFEAAVELLEQGRWREATDAFRIIQAQYPADPVSDVCELYAARAELQELAVLRPTGEEKSAAALSRLATLGSDRGIDDRVRFGALAYYASGLATMGRGDVALAELASYPSPSLSPVVLKRDRQGAQALVAEALSRLGRFRDALEGFSGLYAVSEDPEVREYAKSRGFEMASHLEESDLVELGSDDMAFVRGTAGWTLLDRRARVASDEETKALQDLLRRTTPDLIDIDEGARVEPLSAALSVRGTAPRLAVGVAVPLTGSAAGVGRRAVQGALVAVDAFGGGPPRTTLVFVDSASNSPKEAMASLRTAGVSAVVGPLDAKLAAQWTAAANAAEIPLFALTTEPLGADAGDWGFRWFIDAESEARATARVAVESQGDRRIVVLYPDIGYGRRMAEWFRAEAEARGATLVMYEAYDRSATNYSKLATRVAREKPDAVYIPDTATKVGEVTAFLAQANVWGLPGESRPNPKSKRTEVHYLGTSLWNDPELVKQASSYVRGALIPAWSAPALGESESRFFRDYRNSTNQVADDVAAFAFEIVGFVQRGFATGATDPLSIRQLARSTSAYRGISGATRFGVDGEPIRVLRFITLGSDGFSATNRQVTVGLADET